MSPEDKKALLNVFREISNAWTRAEGERAFVKEAVKNASDKYQIDKKTLRKMAKTWHRQDFKDTVAAEEEFQLMYQDVTGEKVDEE